MSAYQWYREKGEADLAEKLLREAAGAHGRLGSLAHAYQPIEHTPSGEPIRHMPFRTMPYMFVYIIDADDVVQIFACPHIRQQRSWRSGLH